MTQRRTSAYARALATLLLTIQGACSSESTGDGGSSASTSGSESTSSGEASSSGAGGGASGGASSSGAGGSACTAEALAELEASMRLLLDKAGTDPTISSVADYTLMLERDDGRTFVHSHGTSTPTTVYESASTSKWVTAAVLLDLVDQGKLALTTTVASRLPLIWKESAVTLEHLLSFRSGFAEEPLCINAANANFAQCVATIHDQNAGTAPAPGTEFHYASTHLQIAGMMAIKSVAGATSWSDVFSAFQVKTGLFASSVYDLPSKENPRLAGGMHWTADDYFGFLRALYRGKLLSDATRKTLFENHRGAASVAYSPVVDKLGEDWAYGLGNWLECPEAKNGVAFNCASGGRNSSPGAYGSYPFIDFERRYFGLLARQGDVGTFPEGVATFRALESVAAKWAADDCTP